MQRSVLTTAYVEPIALASAIVLLIVFSQNIAAIDQSDYGRATDFFLAGPLDGSRYRPLDPPTADWAIKSGVGDPFQITNSASLYYWIVAMAQRLLRGSFSVIILGSISKAMAMLLVAGLSKRLSAGLGYGRVGRLIGFAALASCFFMAHNILFFNSFYQEHVMYLALPLLLYGMMDETRWRRNLTVTIALAIAGTAKIQYFYLPLLYMLVMLIVGWLERRKLDLALICALSVAQMLSAALLTKNNDRDYNYYHSTYFGSYNFLSSTELDELGVPPQNRRCIGVDAFGVSLAGAQGEHEKEVRYTCYVHRSNVAKTAIEPYLRHPGVLLRLWWFAIDAHWTSKYFLMDVERPYVAPIGGTQFGGGEALLWLTDLRDRWVTKAASAICVASIFCIVILLRRRVGYRVAAGLAFLILCLVSQIVVALVGEGMRDLSKHWAVAQFCLDLVFVLTLIALPALTGNSKRAVLGRDGRSAPPGIGARSDHSSCLGDPA